MTKWVIKKNQAGKLEVWEYIDTIEEAGKYWYVRDAIKKYGVEEILPIAMNSLGGYHPLKYDIERGNIVKIVESDDEPIIENYIRLDRAFDYGWFSPECKPFVCEYMGHLRLATKLAWMKYQYNGALPDDYLMQKGWVKVEKDRTGKPVWIGDWYKINDAQVVWLEKHGISEYGAFGRPLKGAQDD